MNRFTTGLLLILVTWPLAAVAQAPAVAALAEKGQEAMEARQFDQARALFDQGYADARAAGDSEMVLRFIFYRANADLVEATAGGENATELAKSAIERYRTVLQRRPDSGSVMVNTARAYALLQDNARAEAWYRRAIELNDSKQSLYRKQYADYLAERRPEEATRQLRAVADAEPGSLATHRKLLRTYSNPAYAPQLAAYLRGLVDKGEVLRAQNAAVLALKEPGWSADQKAELMVVVGESLARQHLSPAAFADSELARELASVVRADSQLKDCVTELQAVFDAGGRGVDYHWWTADSQRAETLSRLLRSVGGYYRQAQRPEQAEAYYRGAVELGDSADPRAVRDLVEFYTERGDLGKINELSTTYEWELFRGKGEAYKKNDLEAIYEYHRTLGSIYAYQASKSGDWGSMDESASAKFQLEHAWRVARRTGQIVPDAQLVDMLANSRAATGSPDSAAELRLEAAALYQEQRDPVSMAKVLKPLDTAALSPSQRTSYQRLQSAAGAIRPVAPPVDPAPRSPAPAEPVRPDANAVPDAPESVEQSRQAPRITDAPNMARPAAVIDPAANAARPKEQAIQMEQVRQRAPARVREPEVEEAEPAPTSEKDKD